MRGNSIESQLTYKNHIILVKLNNLFEATRKVFPLKFIHRIDLQPSCFSFITHFLLFLSMLSTAISLQFENAQAF